RVAATPSSAVEYPGRVVFSDSSVEAICPDGKLAGTPLSDHVTPTGDTPMSSSRPAPEATRVRATGPLTRDEPLSRTITEPSSRGTAEAPVSSDSRSTIL